MDTGGRPLRSRAKGKRKIRPELDPEDERVVKSQNTSSPLLSASTSRSKVPGTQEDDAFEGAFGALSSLHSTMSDISTSQATQALLTTQELDDDDEEEGLDFEEAVAFEGEEQGGALVEEQLADVDELAPSQRGAASVAGDGMIVESTIEAEETVVGPSERDLAVAKAMEEKEATKLRKTINARAKARVEGTHKATLLAHLARGRVLSARADGAVLQGTAVSMIAPLPPGGGYGPAATNPGPSTVRNADDLHSLIQRWIQTCSSKGILAPSSLWPWEDEGSKTTIDLTGEGDDVKPEIKTEVKPPPPSARKGKRRVVPIPGAVLSSHELPSSTPGHFAESADKLADALSGRRGPLARQDTLTALVAALRGLGFPTRLVTAIVPTTIKYTPVNKNTMPTPTLMDLAGPTARRKAVVKEEKKKGAGKADKGGKRKTGLGGVKYAKPARSTALLKSPRVWCEVWLEGEERWVPVNPMAVKPLDADKFARPPSPPAVVSARYSVPRPTVTSRVVVDNPEDYEMPGELYCYVIGFEGSHRFTDVTRRYARVLGDVMAERPGGSAGLKWMDQLWDLGETGGAEKGAFTALERRATAEAAELDKATRKEPLPTSIGAYKKHPLFAIERDLGKMEILHPREPVLGYIGKHAVYPRANVHELKTEVNWKKKGKGIIPGERPARYMRRRKAPLSNRASGLAARERAEEAERREREGEEDGLVIELDESNFRDEPPSQDTRHLSEAEAIAAMGEKVNWVGLYGGWQVEDYKPPRCVNGRIPVNEFGNCELFHPAMLPEGARYLTGHDPTLVEVCVEGRFEHVKAMVGWEFHRGKARPDFRGVIVLEYQADSIITLYNRKLWTDVASVNQRRSEIVLDRWARLTRALLVRARVRARYAEDVEEGAGQGTVDDDGAPNPARAGTSKSASVTSTVSVMEGVDDSEDEVGCKHQFDKEFTWWDPNTGQHNAACTRCGYVSTI